VKRGFVACLPALGWLGVVTPALAQEMPGMDDHEGHGWRHTGAFYTRRAPDGCTLCGASLDLNGGYYFIPREGAINTREGFLRAHFQAGFPLPVLEVSGDLLWVPEAGATPTISFVMQAAPIPENIPVHLSLGVGGITGRDVPGRDRLRGWAQAVLAYRSPFHEITPFVQIGRVLDDDRHFELLFGVAHPVFPWRAHLF